MQVQMRWENKLVAVATSPHSLPKEEQTRQVKSSRKDMRGKLNKFE